jgi:hypothetical protein
MSLSSRFFSRLPFPLRVVLPAAVSIAFALPLQAQSAPPGTDVIVFTNGDQLTGKLSNEVNGKVTFHSDIAGDVTVTWDKIKSIKTSQQFAVVQQDQHVNRKTAKAEIAQGNVAVQDDKVTVTPAGGGAGKDIPVKNTQFLVDQATYDKEVLHSPGFFYGWTGGVTAGASTIEATQNSRNFTGSVALVRTIPTPTWLDPRTRTTVDFNAAYGSVTQPGTTGTKTNIIGADAEQDWYISPRFYFLAAAAFTHDYSQGLSLQQSYGGGMGYTVLKSAKQELDVKFDIHYEKQTYFVTPNVVPPPPLTPSKNLIGADFGDSSKLKLPKGLLFSQTAVITPSFNISDAYSAMATAGLLFPTYKNLGFTLGTVDDFLNDPAIGSKKNSFQFTAGVTYTLK